MLIASPRATHEHLPAGHNIGQKLQAVQLVMAVEDHEVFVVGRPTGLPSRSTRWMEVPVNDGYDVPEWTSRTFEGIRPFVKQRTEPLDLEQR